MSRKSGDIAAGNPLRFVSIPRSANLTVGLAELTGAEYKKMIRRSAARYQSGAMQTSALVTLQTPLAAQAGSNQRQK